jgi:hypothetical protein
MKLYHKRMPSREDFFRTKHKEQTRLRGLKLAMDEMVDHINEATAGEFGSFSIFEMDNISKKAGRQKPANNNR